MSLEVHFPESYPNEFTLDLLEGLSKSPPSIPCKYLYDDQGSTLFNQICEVEEYYPTRTELSILARFGSDIASKIGPHARLVELGAGSGLKTRFLLDELVDPEVYVPVDISGTELRRCAQSIASEYTSLRVAPVRADYTNDWSLPTLASQGRTVFYFPGSTIGNFSRQEASAFLFNLLARGGKNCSLLIGVDLHKDLPTLEAAYNDEAGVTAAFNLNLLTRINRECNATIDVNRFTHQAIYDQEKRRIEMRLISCCDQLITIQGRSFAFQEGDFIVTEHSHKYSIEDFAALSENAGWRARAFWTDRRHRFSVWYLESPRF